MITRSAIKYPDGEVVQAVRHWQIIGIQAKMGIKTDSSCIQGFVNHKDEFLTREQAKKEAIKEKQIPKDHEGELYSEDLWPVFLGEDNDV